MPDNKVTQKQQRGKSWYVDNWDIEANNNTYYSITSGAAAAQVANTHSYISFYSEKDFKGLKVKENSEKLKLLSENFPFFQRVSGDGLCGFHAAIVATLAKCSNDPQLLKKFRNNLEQYSEKYKDNETKVEAKKIFGSILKKLPEDNLTFDRFYELVSEEGQDNISKKLAKFLFINADFSPKIDENHYQKEARNEDLKAQKAFIKDSKSKILVSDFAVMDIMNKISPFKITTITAENLEDQFVQTKQNNIYIVNGDGSHFDILYSKSDENIIKASQKVIKDNNQHSTTVRISDKEYRKRINQAQIDQFKLEYSKYSNKPLNQKEKKISFAENDEVIEFSSEENSKELKHNPKFFDQKVVQNTNLGNKYFKEDNKAHQHSATVRISDEEYQKRIDQAKIDQLKLEYSKYNNKGLNQNPKFFDQKVVQSTNLGNKYFKEDNKAHQHSATVRISDEEYQKRIDQAKINEKVSLVKKDKINEFDISDRIKKIVKDVQNSRERDEKLNLKKISKEYLDLNHSAEFLPSTDLRSKVKQDKKSPSDDVNDDKSHKFRKIYQKAIEIIIKSTTEERNGYQIFNNKLINALDKTNKAVSRFGKGKEREVWKSLTTLDKRVLVESYNQSHKEPKIEFDNLFRAAKQNEKVELTIKSQNYVLDETKISDLRKVLDYASSLKFPSSTFRKTSIASLKEKDLGTSIAQ